MTSKKTVERLSLYRRFLNNLDEDGVDSIYSHKLASMCSVTAAIVRRDLMSVGYYGNPKHGYQIKGLIKCIDKFFYTKTARKILLIGIGNLGRALLAYFSKGRSHLNITAAFDKDQTKTNRIICNTPAYHTSELEKVIKEKGLKTGIINVPDIEAQKVAEQLVENGITSILNFAPIRLKVPKNVFVENVDITMLLEKAVYFSKSNNKG